MGQNPAGFFFRFSWLFSFFMLVLAYQVVKGQVEISRRGKLLSVVLLVLSAIYLYTKKFTYLPKTQPEALTQFLSKNVLVFWILLIAITAACSYLYWSRSRKAPQVKKMVLLIAGAVVLLLGILLQTGYLLSQVVLTLLVYLAVIFLLHTRMTRLAILSLSALTSLN